MNIHLLVIDPQNDFCDPSGSLYVPGADADMERVASMVRRLSADLDAIHITLDSHHKLDISHPLWWRDSKGRHPAPFTLISAADVEAGRWATSVLSAQERSLEYLRALEAAGRYPHTIWPEHCLIGDAGHNVAPVLADAVHEWEARYRQADFVAKGDNPWTEHFSAVKAEVPDPADSDSQLNTAFVASLETADVILVAGEAATHCVMNTVADIADCFTDARNVEKLVWLTDATSPVPDPPDNSLFSDKLDEVLADLVGRGMKTSTTDQVLR